MNRKYLKSSDGIRISGLHMSRMGDFNESGLAYFPVSPGSFVYINTEGKKAFDFYCQDEYTDRMGHLPQQFHPSNLAVAKIYVRGEDGFPVMDGLAVIDVNGNIVVAPAFILRPILMLLVSANPKNYAEKIDPTTYEDEKDSEELTE